MKPCRKQNQSTGTPAVSQQPMTSQRSTPPQEVSVRRYVHPIRTAKPPARDPTEEMLSYVLDALSHQSEQLDEVLRRLDGDNSDTI